MDQSGTGDTLAFFGLDGASGEYLLKPVASELAAVAQAEELPGAHVQDLKNRVQSQQPSLGVADTVEDPADLAQAGWGVVFADNADPAIRDALSVLIRWRAEQARGRHEGLFQEYAGTRGYHAGESKRDFLRARGAPPSGPVDPLQMPYYLLLVGDPEAIPYALQYQLDVQYAVGRICFDTPDQYARYAQSVVAAEQAHPRPRQITLVGVANADDTPTRLSSTQLVQPLAERLSIWQASQAEGSRWAVQNLAADATDKAHLGPLLGGAETPALLFTASHGVAFAKDDPRQRHSQGALVCRDWPGPLGWQGAIPPEYYLAAEDIGDDARLAGLIAFFFACFGAGTPYRDDFPQLSQGPLSEKMAQAIAPQPFVGPLPQRLLGHPAGGALAVIGHVERALGSSFLWSSSAGRQTSVTSFESCLRRLMRGQPVGLAMEAFNQRYAELCAELSQAVRRISEEGRVPDHELLAQLWMGSTDARGYVVVGDPAVRLAAVGQPTPGDGVASTVVVSADAAPVASASSPTGRVVAAASNPAASPTPLNEVTPLMTRAAAIRIDVDPNTAHITLTTDGGTLTTESRAGPAPSSGASSEEVAYGWLGGSAEDADSGPRSALLAGLRGIAEQLTTAVGKLASDVSTLSVSTYTGDDLGAVTFDADKRAFVGPALLRAFTNIRFDGDTVSIVPRDGAAVDEQLWQIHKDMVERAQAHRAEFLSAAAAAASSLFSAMHGS